MTVTNELIIQARKEILINKDYQKAILLLNNDEESSDNRVAQESIALALLESGEYNKAAEIYKNLGFKYNAGYCELLLGNEAEAAKLWNEAVDCSPVRWGKCVLDYIKLRSGPVPTYLQVRNYLETDIGYFIQAHKIKYAESLLKYDEIFLSINIEAYKLIGRVLLNYGFLNQSRKYLMQSLGVVPNDAEALYCLAKYHYHVGANRESQRALERCLENNQSHTPARKLLAKVNIKIKLNN